MTLEPTVGFVSILFAHMGKACGTRCRVKHTATDLPSSVHQLISGCHRTCNELTYASCRMTLPVSTGPPAARCTVQVLATIKSR